MLKPILTTKGKTDRCLRKYHLTNEIIGTHSNNGWTNNGIIKIALDEIHKITNGHKSTLVLDQFPAHMTEYVKEYAKNKNITLIYVPIGLTYKYQPFDVSINGILKKKGKKNMERRYYKKS